MVTKTVVSVVDDIDGSDSAETVTFTYQGATYEIDLARKNRDALDAALSPFIEAARSTSRGGAPRAKAQVEQDPAAIRAWAADNGIEVSARGRIPRSVRDQYKNR
ncbi:histone-like nucleoid-structuring protein Lsr2 [Micromonospora sp. DT81.3]|uniref:histone-like nucleoid-structuring protein Lsr2 n=1 Tax=Micromonospora sp. DT81.3 TaxID=3416523 RepID=UPI003CF03A52